MVQDISSPANRSHSSPKKATVMASIIGSGGKNLFHPPFRNVTGGAGYGTPSNIIGIPVPPVTQEISVLFNRHSNEVKVVCFGKLEFLDNQKHYEKKFGDKPTISPTNPVLQESSTASKSLYAFSKKCKL